MTAPQQIRFWHPAHDPYHCSFRFLRILDFQAERSLSFEKLCILDFYLLYPFLLHRSSMPDATRRLFRALHIGRAEDQFVQMPSEKALFRDLLIYQRAASNNLVAKGIFDRQLFLAGTTLLNQSAIPAKLLSELRAQNETERPFMDFLVNHFGALELVGARGLRALTGLVRRRS